MAKDVPDVFEGTVEVDETYLGEQKKNKRKSQFKKDIQEFGKESKRGLEYHKTACIWHIMQVG